MPDLPFLYSLYCHIIFSYSHNCFHYIFIIIEFLLHIDERDIITQYADYILATHSVVLSLYHSL